MQIVVWLYDCSISNCIVFLSRVSSVSSCFSVINTYHCCKRQEIHSFSTRGSLMVYILKLISLDALAIKSNETTISTDNWYIFLLDHLVVRMHFSYCATLCLYLKWKLSLLVSVTVIKELVRAISIASLKLKMQLFSKLSFLSVSVTRQTK